MTATIATLPPAPAPLRGPFRLAVAIMVVTTLTILKGAMTTSTGSGLAYPDWPLSDGQVMPESSLTTIAGFLEHFHRLFAVSAGLLALLLALWLHFGRRASEPTAELRREAVRLCDARVRGTAWLGGCLLLGQAVVGGVGVLLRLPAVTSVTHATLAQLTLATFAWLAYQLSDRHWRTEPLATVAPGTGRKLVLFALGVLLVQTVIGALARHTGSPHALWTHVGNAFVVFVIATITTAFAVGKLGAAPGIKPVAQWITSLLILQIVLGFVVLAIRPIGGKSPENVNHLGTASVISIHVVIGALLTVLMALLAAHVYRATRAPVARGAA